MAIDDRVPAHWHGPMEQAGFDSANALSAKAKRHTSTVMKLLRGEGESSPETIDAVRRALGLGVNEMSELLGRKVPRSTDGPPEFGLLSRKQQAAIVGVIKAMLEPENLSSPTSTNITSIEATKRRQGPASDRHGDETGRAARRGREKDDPGVSGDR